MMKWFVIVLLQLSFKLYAQELKELDTIQPSSSYENIHVRKIADDPLQSSFVIWVKDHVKAHYHADHTENIYVIDGKAEMLLGSETIEIKKGDYINIPKKTPHAVTKVLSRSPLMVLSIQSPQFEGKDRIFIENK